MLLHLVTVNADNVDNPDVGLYGENADAKKVLEDIKLHVGKPLYYRDQVPELKKDVPIFSHGVSGVWTTTRKQDGEYEVNVYAIQVRQLPLFQVRAFGYQLPVDKYNVIFDKEAYCTSVDAAKEEFQRLKKDLEAHLQMYRKKSEGWVKIIQMKTTLDNRLMPGSTIEGYQFNLESQALNDGDE